MRLRVALFGGGVAVVVLGVAAGVALWPRDGQTQTTSPVTTSYQPVMMKAPPLDGTYRMDFDGSSYTVNGRPSPISNQDPAWRGFRSACSETACVATSAGLDTHNLSAPNTAPSLTLRWTEEGWRGGNTAPTSCPGPDGDDHEQLSTFWSLRPAPNGGYSGILTNTVMSDECWNQGDVYEQFFTLSRTGAVPPGVVADPPTDDSGLPPAPVPPTQAHTAPPASAQVFLGGQPLVISGPPICRWIDRQLTISIPGSGKSNSAMVEFTGTTAKSVTFEVNDVLFLSDTSPYGSASASQTGKKSFTIDGIVVALDNDRSTRGFEIQVTCP